MADPVIASGINPLGYKGFITNSHRADISVTPSQDGGGLGGTKFHTVISPVATCLIVSSITKKQWILRNITAIQANNTLEFSVPRSNIDFVLNPSETLPPIGPMDEIYVFAANYFSGNDQSTSNIGYDPAFIATQGYIDVTNRIATGMINRVFRKWDRGVGQMFTIEFSTFMQKFNITSEMKPLGNLNNQTFGPPTPNTSNLPISVLANMSEQFLSAPGVLVKAACIESNVQWKYIFDPVSEGKAQTIGFGSGSIDINQNKNAIDFPDGIRTDDLGVQLGIDVPLFEMADGRFFHYNPITYVFQTWSQRLSQIAESNFCEMFFSRYGQFYYRQLGMFTPAKKWDTIIAPDLIVDYQDWEDSDSIVTELDVRFDIGNTGGADLSGGHVFGAPNMRQLEQLYGRRFRQVSLPIMALGAKPSQVFKDANAGKNLLTEYARAFSQFYMARANANNIRGQATVIGSQIYEIGSTVYFTHSDRAFYIVGVKHFFEIGKGWTTSLSLTYGRPGDSDLFNFVSQRAIELGLDSSRVPTINTPTITNESVPPMNGFDAVVPNYSGRKLSPLNKPPTGVGYNYGDLEPPNSLEPIHTGVDLDTPTGTVLVAVLDGTVVYKNLDLASSEGWGYYVIIQSHPDGGLPVLNYAYAHMISPALVNVGDEVFRGSTIGFSGSTGNSTGPHLHFEVFQPNTGNNNVMPPNYINTTVNPWKIIDIAGSSGTPDAIFVQNDTAGGVSAGNLVQNDDGRTWRDPQFKDDVTEFGSIISGILGGPKEFYMALSTLETNWGRVINPRWNMTNVGNSQVGNGAKYNDVGEAANGFIRFIANGSPTNTYKPFLDYMKSSAGSFSSLTAANLLYITGKYIDPPDEERARSLARITDQLSSGVWAGGY